MNPFALSGLLAGVFSTTLAFFVWLMSSNKRLGKAWLFFALSVASWGFGSMAIALTKDPIQSLWTWRIADIFGIILIPALFYSFVCVFCEIERTFLIRTHFLMAVVFLAFSQSPLFIPNVRWVFNSFYYSVSGKLYPWFSAWWFLSIIFTHVELIRYYKVSPPEKRNQIKYFLLATVVGFSGGSLCYLPVFHIDIYPWGNFTIFLYSCIMSYAILKHHLMDVSIIIRKTLVYSVMTAMLTGIYLLIATQLAHVLQGYTGAASFWSAAVAAGVITLLFNPLLNKVRTFTDRQVFGDWLRDMSRGVIHEVKRPLASISLPAELTLMELEDIEKGKRSFKSFMPEFKERMRHIVRQSLEIGRSIEALYAVSDSDARPMEAVDLNNTIQAALASMKSAVEEHRVQVDTQLSKSLPAVKGNAKQLEIVLGNLIKNSVEAMSSTNGGSKPMLRMSAWEEGKSVVFSLKDSGPGIRSSDVGRLFEPGYTTKGSKGMGLGLYLSQKIIRAHGGSIEVKSEEGKGTEFIVRLPKQTAESRSGVHEAA